MNKYVLIFLTGVLVTVGGVAVMALLTKNKSTHECETTTGVQCDSTQCDSTKCDTVKCH